MISMSKKKETEDWFRKLSLSTFFSTPKHTRAFPQRNQKKFSQRLVSRDYKHGSLLLTSTMRGDTSMATMVPNSCPLVATAVRRVRSDTGHHFASNR